MDSPNLYQLSDQVNQLVGLSKELFDTHMLRHKFLIDNSTDGYDCKYAHINLKFFNQDIELELTKMRQVQRLSATIVEQLENEIKNNQ